MTGTFEPRQHRAASGRRLAGLWIPDPLNALPDQVAGDVGKPARRTAEMRADEVEGIKTVRVSVEDCPLVDEHGRRANRILRRPPQFEGGRILVDRVRIQETERFEEGGGTGDR